MNQLISLIEITSILSLVTLAAALTFRLAGFPDLSVDSVFTFGAVVFAKALLANIPPVFCILIALCAGGLAGFTTALISNKLRIHPLLASVLMLIILYSVNLRVLGRANQPVFSITEGFFGVRINLILVLISLGTIFVLSLYLFFQTNLGSAIRAAGQSSLFLISVGRNSAQYKIILVSIAGALVALSGCLLSIKYGFADISMGHGVIITGIASLIIGEKICGRWPFYRQVCAVPVGILILQISVSTALVLGISPIDVKLATGVITIILLALGRKSDHELVT